MRGLILGVCFSLFFLSACDDEVQNDADVCECPACGLCDPSDMDLTDLPPGDADVAPDTNTCGPQPNSVECCQAGVTVALICGEAGWSCPWARPR